MINKFLEGIIYYPVHLPCPQIEIDLVPRERRYLSDIGDVRNLRMFQQEFQATRNRISFVFTEEEAREFRDWYDNVIFGGGAWFYADWPTLDKECKIAYRFVGQPEYEWLFGANPGAIGRSVAGTAGNGAVTMYKVHAVVELYYRKVGVYGNVFTSKIYPSYFSDGIQATHTPIRSGSIPPKLYPSDSITASTIIAEGVMSGYIYGDYEFVDDITALVIITEATMKTWIYSDYSMFDDIVASHTTILSGEITFKRIDYDKFDDSMTASHTTIVAGEIA